MTDAIVLFERAVDGFGAHVRAVGAGQWHDPTPDTEWDVRMLVNHVTVEQLWVPPLVGGKSVADVGSALDGDQLGDDPRGVGRRRRGFARGLRGTRRARAAGVAVERCEERRANTAGR